MRRLFAMSGLLLLFGANVASAQPPRAVPPKAGSQKAGSPKAKAAVPVTTLSAADTLDPVQPSIDHARFDALLHQHVSHGLVDYAAFRNNPEFAKYLASLSTIDPSKYEEPERIAFWLNVYNAYTIQLVASRGETKSIRNIDKTFGLLSLKGPWSEPFVKAAGRTLTLDDVEHRILRKEFSEPRVHFAMSFAAMGGPPLRSEAYTGAKLEDQLEDQARIFLRESPTKNRVDTSRFTVYASPILTRYSADFGESSTALGAFLAQYYPEGSGERKLLKPRALRAREFNGADSVKPVAVKPGASKSDSAAAAKAAAAAEANRKRALRSVFRLVETPFDWSLNIQQPGKP